MLDATWDSLHSDVDTGDVNAPHSCGRPQPSLSDSISFPVEAPTYSKASISDLRNPVAGQIVRCTSESSPPNGPEFPELRIPRSPHTSLMAAFMGA